MPLSADPARGRPRAGLVPVDDPQPDEAGRTPPVHRLVLVVATYSTGVAV